MGAERPVPTDSIRMRLSSDPREALREIAGYLRTVSFERSAAVIETEKDGEPAIRIACVPPTNPNLLGYWQMSNWLLGLLEIADECDRILANNEEVRHDGT